MLELPKENLLDINVFQALIEYKKLTNSYKIYFLLGIYKEIIEGNKEITLKRLAIRMISSAWYSVVEYKLNFGLQDQLPDIVKYVYNKYNLEKNIKEKDLISFLEELKDDNFEKMYTSKLLRYVPYRLISPFFSEELRGKKDGEKDKLITQLSKNSKDALYYIDETNCRLIINDRWFNYIYKNQGIIYGWIQYELIYFLQKRNTNVPAIPFKLTAPYSRNLKLAIDYWQLVISKVMIRDIYTNKEFNEESFKLYGSLSIDHFIPWNFVLHDELWNLAPTFKNINSSKNDNLPDLKSYLDSFCECQFIAFETTIKLSKGSSRILEDYLNINKSLNIRNLVKDNIEIDKISFIKSIKSTIEPLYQIAINQGYEIWRYRQLEFDVKNKDIENGHSLKIKNIYT